MSAGLRVEPMGPADARAVARWRYPPPYDIYNIADEPLELAAFLAGIAGYYRVLDAAGELVAFCCFGAEARVPGGDYSAPALDLGLGVRPDLTGRGQGRRYLDAITGYAERSFAPPALRLTVAGFNQRAIRLYSRAGFREAQRFLTPFSGREFLIMLRPASGG